MEADISTQAVGLASSADFSLMNLFLRADIVVKSVIILFDPNDLCTPVNFIFAILFFYIF